MNGAVNRFFVKSFFGGIPEKSRFHSISKKDYQESNIRVHLSDYTELQRDKNSRMQRHKQVIQESGDDAAQPVNGSLPCKIFNLFQNIAYWLSLIQSR